MISGTIPGFQTKDQKYKIRYAYFLAIASHTRKTEKLCSWMYLLENNQVQQFLKLIILRMSWSHVCDLSKPRLVNWYGKYNKLGNSYGKYNKCQSFST